MTYVFFFIWGFMSAGVVCAFVGAKVIDRVRAERELEISRLREALLRTAAKLAQRELKNKL